MIDSDEIAGEIEAPPLELWISPHPAVILKMRI